jgi:hypothetical protein
MRQGRIEPFYDTDGGGLARLDKDGHWQTYSQASTHGGQRVGGDRQSPSKGRLRCQPTACRPRQAPNARTTSPLPCGRRAERRRGPLAAGEALRASPVAKAQPSPAAKRKATTKQSEAGHPVCSFRSLLRHLACLTRNTVRFGRNQTSTLLTAPTAVQHQAFKLLGITLQT